MRRSDLSGIISRAAIGLGLALLFVTDAGAAPVVAQGSEAVPSTECTVVPITTEALTEAASSYNQGDASDVVAIGSGEPAGETIIASVTEVVRQSVACTNANSPLQALALFSLHYLQERFGPAPQDDLGHLIAALSRSVEQAAEGDVLTLVSVEQVAILPDGRVSALVTTANAATTFTDILVFVLDEESWKIDEVAQASVSGTPVPA